MTQEEKNLLLQDLCGRLPYGVVVVGVDDNKKPISTAYTLYNLDIRFPWTDCYAVLPYLRPISSMIEEERNELKQIMKCDAVTDESLEYTVGGCVDIESFLVYYENISKLTDWLNKKMFDFRGLIPAGLANAAPEGMYNS